MKRVVVFRTRIAAGLSAMLSLAGSAKTLAVAAVCATLGMVPAQASIVPISQYRIVEAEAHAAHDGLADHQGPFSIVRSDLDFSPFIEFVLAHATMGGAVGHALTSQSSSVGASLLDVAANIEVSGSHSAPESGTLASGNGYSAFFLSFDLTAPSPVRLDASLSALLEGEVSGGFFGHVMLDGPGGTLFLKELPETGPWVYEADLPAGLYVLSMGIAGGGELAPDGFGGAAFDGWAEMTGRLELVPEPASLFALGGGFMLLRFRRRKK